MNILAETAAVVLAAAALCGLGVGTAAASTSDQVSGTTYQDRFGLGNGWGLPIGWVPAGG